MLQSVDVWTRLGVIQGGPSGRRNENGTKNAPIRNSHTLCR